MRSALLIDTLQLCHCEEWNDAAIRGFCGFAQLEIINYILVIYPSGRARRVQFFSEQN